MSELNNNNNTIDKFGRRWNRAANIQVVRGPPGVGFKLDFNGHYDLEGKSLTNVLEPTNIGDATTKQYVDSKVFELRKSMSNIVNEKINNLVTNLINEEIDKAMPMPSPELTQATLDRQKCMQALTVLKTRIDQLERKYLEKTVMLVMDETKPKTSAKKKTNQKKIDL